MEQLKKSIIEQGSVRTKDILDVSKFLNAHVDAQLMSALGQDFADYYKDYDFDLFATVETSGIAPSVFASLYANKPLLIIKKEGRGMDEAIYVQQDCFSYTKDVSYKLTAKKEFLSGKKVVLLDDFLAQGSVVKNVESLLDKVGSTLVSTGICVTKNFQPGYKALTDEGYDLYAQVELESLDPETGIIKFAK